MDRMLALQAKARGEDNGGGGGQPQQQQPQQPFVPRYDVIAPVQTQTTTRPSILRPSPQPQTVQRIQLTQPVVQPPTVQRIQLSSSSSSNSQPPRQQQQQQQPYRGFGLPTAAATAATTRTGLGLPTSSASSVTSATYTPSVLATIALEQDDHVVRTRVLDSARLAASQATLEQAFSQVNVNTGKRQFGAKAKLEDKVGDKEEQQQQQPNRTYRLALAQLQEAVKLRQRNQKEKDQSNGGAADEKLLKQREVDIYKLLVAYKSVRPMLNSYLKQHPEKRAKLKALLLQFQQMRYTDADVADANAKFGYDAGFTALPTIARQPPAIRAY